MTLRRGNYLAGNGAPNSTALIANGASAQLLAAVVDRSLLTEQPNLLRLLFHPLGARRYIVNWDDVARHLLGRAERELSAISGAEQMVPRMSFLVSMRHVAFLKVAKAPSA